MRNITIENKNLKKLSVLVDSRIKNIKIINEDFSNLQINVLIIENLPTDNSKEYNELVLDFNYMLNQNVTILQSSQNYVVIDNLDNFDSFQKTSKINDFFWYEEEFSNIDESIEFYEFSNENEYFEKLDNIKQ